MNSRQDVVQHGRDRRTAPDAGAGATTVALVRRAAAEQSTTPDAFFQWDPQSHDWRGADAP